jgi:hypothetical protein
VTKGAILPLESLRLTQYVTPIACYVCAADNTYDAESCTHCGAPMALAHQAQSQDVHPQLVACLGASGAGKTVYLGMLMDMLSRRPELLQLLARGAFSITLQQQTISALAACEFPQKTPNEPDRWNWVHCQIRRPPSPQLLELIVPDMAGEALLEEVDHPRTYRVVGAFLKKCAGAMLLVDATHFLDSARQEDFFSMKLLSYLSELRLPAGEAWDRKPLAVIFTKADQVEECLEDPPGFARQHAVGLWQHCHERFARHRFFAAGVAGSCALRESMLAGRMQVPLRIEPRGVLEPFLWLLDQMPAAEPKRRR